MVRVLVEFCVVCRVGSVFLYDGAVGWGCDCCVRERGGSGDLVTEVKGARGE